MMACAASGLKVSGTGSWKRASFGSGAGVRVEPIKLSYFALGIREWARRI